MIALFFFACQEAPSSKPLLPDFTMEMAHITRDNHDFWIDRYEYPNKKGQLPIAKMSFYDAQNHCQSQGKRLCTAQEWTLSCSQGQGLRFAYGNAYQAGKCNANQVNQFGHTSLMQQQELHATSGAFFNCKTEDDVYDLNGNLEEWVLDDWKGNPGALMGGAWYTYWSYADCSGAYSHQPDYRMPMDTQTESAGTRCCWSSEESLLADMKQLHQNNLDKERKRSIDVPYDPQNEVEWKKGHWIDRYEYPNRKGAYPLVGLSWNEARTRCQEYGKDLCSVSSWEQACAGKNGLSYPYGSGYRPYTCLDSSNDGRKPSGAKEGCQSETGVFDMTGSVWEWTSSDLTVPELQDDPHQALKEIRGGSWFSDPLKAQCAPTVGYPIVGSNHQLPDLGFRCCREEHSETTAGKPLPAQLVCPTNMRAIGEFCIDTFEYPNRKGESPLSNVNLEDATRYCQKEGKSLCTDQQWLLACQGLEKRRWSYGNEYQRDRCFHSSNANIGSAIPAGERENCQTPEGVHDMTGNLWEWTASGKLRGGNWNFSEGMGQCRAKADPSRAVRSVEYGFRCCLMKN